MEESGSVNLEETVRARTDFFCEKVDWVCISDNYFLGKNKPCLTYGLRGQTYFYIEVKGPKQDLHSGVFGGSIAEPMVELSHLFASLVDTQGHILVDGAIKEVDEITEDEKGWVVTLNLNINMKIILMYNCTYVFGFNT
jgi:acetylornithine deacetylase/succinyl-diaminopimelate desuccinylase-like protein